MIMSEKYVNNTLLRLRRKYSKDETVSALNKKLSEVEFNNGVLQSEIDELKHLLKLKEKQEVKNLNLIERQQIKIKASEDDFKETQLYKNLKGKIKHDKNKFDNQKVLLDSLYRKIYSLNSEISELSKPQQ